MQPYYLTTTGAGPQQTTQYFVPAQYYEAATLDHHHQALALASPHQHHSSAAAAAMHLSSPNGMHHHHHGHNHNHNHNHGAHLMPQVPPADLETFSSALSTMHGQVSGFLVEEDHKRTPKSKGGARRNVTCACLPCRQAHVSCSETRPCPRCVRKGSVCTFRREPEILPWWLTFISLLCCCCCCCCSTQNRVRRPVGHCQEARPQARGQEAKPREFSTPGW